jgi:hypothetical protein
MSNYSAAWCLPMLVPCLSSDLFTGISPKVTHVLLSAGDTQECSQFANHAECAFLTQTCVHCIRVPSKLRLLLLHFCQSMLIRRRSVLIISSVIHVCFVRRLHYKCISLCSCFLTFPQYVCHSKCRLQVTNSRLVSKHAYPADTRSGNSASWKKRKFNWGN